MKKQKGDTKMEARKDKRYNIVIKGNKYAPETVCVYNNGVKVIIDNANSMLKQWAVTGNNRFLPELKRVIRQNQKKTETYYTIGFKTDDGHMLYPYYFHISDRFNLKEMYEIYKSMKNVCQKRGWQYNNIMIEQGELEINGEKAIEKKFVKNTISKKPILIKLSY